MTYLALSLYVLGIFTHYLLGKAIIELDQKQLDVGVGLQIFASILWPVATIYYLSPRNPK